MNEELYKISNTGNKNRLQLKEKKEMLKHLELGATIKDTAIKFNCTEQIVTNIYKTRTKFFPKYKTQEIHLRRKIMEALTESEIKDILDEFFKDTNGKHSSSSCRVGATKMSSHSSREVRIKSNSKVQNKSSLSNLHVEKRVIKWLEENSENNERITEAMIRRKSLEFARSMGFKEFRVNRKWLQSFNKRYGIERRLYTKRRNEKVGLSQKVYRVKDIDNNVHYFQLLDTSALENMSD
ncbi:hypothetical protein HHI36_002436 [Cryptolaemus montrouzieri]|uniref:HTH CENPB-type domain-containing protein n=1 Tax=Cryptolaemus montrouzieri TaxID=559131 RepID=A0ABD2PBB2_9CUCU